MPLVGIHRLQRHIPPVLEYPRGHLLRQPLQALLPFKPVVFRVHMYPDPLLAALVDGVIGQLLDRVQGLAPAPNERPQLIPLQDDLIPSCTLMRPATSLIGVSSGSVCVRSVTVS